MLRLSISSKHVKLPILHPIGEQSPESALVGIYADKVDILHEDGTVLVSREQRFEPERTDSNDDRTTLCTLMKNPSSWESSGIRRQAPALLRDYLD